MRKVVLVTGGSRGIGKEICLLFSKKGWDVAFTFKSEIKKSEEVKNEITSVGSKCKSYQFNAGNPGESDILVKRVLEEFGRIDVLVNNAGIVNDNLLVRMCDEQWNEVLTTNLTSTFYTTRAAVKFFMRAHGGNIVNISSVMGIRGNAGQSNYSASKAGIIGFTKSIARELSSKKIRVNAVAPGFIKTDMTSTLSNEAWARWKAKVPLGDVGNSIDVANACWFLASDEASYITGQILQVDGGLCI